MNREKIVKKYCTVDSNKRHVDFVNDCIVAFVPDSDMPPRHEGVAIIVGENWNVFKAHAAYEKPFNFTQADLERLVQQGIISPEQAKEYLNEKAVMARLQTQDLLNKLHGKPQAQLKHKLPKPENMPSGALSNLQVQNNFYKAVAELQEAVEKLLNK